MISAERNRQTNLPTVTETRAPGAWRALPRRIRERIVGNPEKALVGLETSNRFLVRYQDFVGLAVTRVRCWKCGTIIVGIAPALQLPPGAKRDANAQFIKVTIDGQELLLGMLLARNHYREGLCTYRTADGRLAQFSYLHCADCTLTDADGEDLLACHVGGLDHLRDTIKSAKADNDDAWAQYMYHWSGVEVVGLAGPSHGVKELMDEAMKKGAV